ncbi:hypothetical protein SNEBB_003075 [Seison nebaliae]|nr:hypothetical protein SNEBB_003075 [Seison nebaliae]
MLLRKNNYLLNEIILKKNILKIFHSNLSNGNSNNSQDISSIVLTHDVYDHRKELDKKLNRWLFISHGLFGNRSNWRSLAKSISENSGYKVVTLDGRNHGNVMNHVNDGGMSYDEMCEDLRYTIQHIILQSSIEEEKTQEATVAVLGHSMGGKTAINLSLKYPEVVDQLIVVDSSLLKSTHIKQFENYLHLMMDFGYPSITSDNSSLYDVKKEFDEKLKSIESNKMIRDFLSTNIGVDDESVHWKLNVPKILQNLHQIADIPILSNMTNIVSDCLFIRGGDSTHVPPFNDDNENTNLINNAFKKVKFVEIPDAGHWVHSEQPLKFREVIVKFLRPKERLEENEMKLKFSGVDLMVALQDVKKTFQSFRLVNIYDIDQKVYLFKFQMAKQCRSMLLLESGARFHVTNFEWKKNDMPSSFSMKLRKHLKGKRLEKITQLGSIDRIIDFQFGSGEVETHIILELFAKGNIILTNSSYEILHQLRFRRHTIKRQLENDCFETKHQIYDLSQARTLEPLMKLDGQRSNDDFEKMKVFLKECKPQEFLRKVLLKKYVFGQQLIVHCLMKRKIPVDIKLKEVEEKYYVDIYQSLCDCDDELMEIQHMSSTKGYITFTEESVISQGALDGDGHKQSTILFEKMLNSHLDKDAGEIVGRPNKIRRFV